MPLTATTQNITPLIPLASTDDGLQAVMGRDLHQFLEITTPYRKWFPRMVEYGFAAGMDYADKKVRVRDSLGRESDAIDHIISLDMAKEISMIQRTEKGKQARQYFLECERIAKQPALDSELLIERFQLPRNYGEALRALADTTEELEAATTENTALKGGNGIRIKDFIKTYFVAPNERAFFEWFYFHGLLIDGRIKDDSGRSARTSSGPKLRWDHMHPTYIGRRYFKLVPSGVNPHGNKTSKVIPERAISLVGLLLNAPDLQVQMTVDGREAADEVLNINPNQLRLVDGN